MPTQVMFTKSVKVEISQKTFMSAVKSDFEKRNF